MIIVSTDGSCLRNPGGAIGWAWVNHEGNANSGGEISGTNQIAELRAVLEAVRAHPGAEPLFIESDSLYAIKCSSEWVNSWRNNGWRTSTGGPVKNVELIKDIDGAISGRPGPVRFRWVRGHVGNYFNEKADALAGEAARSVAVSTAVSTAVAEAATTEIPVVTAAKRSHEASAPAAPKVKQAPNVQQAPKVQQENAAATGKAAGKAAAPPVTQTLTLF